MADRPCLPVMPAPCGGCSLPSCGHAASSGCLAGPATASLPAITAAPALAMGAAEEASGSSFDALCAKMNVLVSVRFILSLWFFFRLVWHALGWTDEREEFVTNPVVLKGLMLRQVKRCFMLSFSRSHRRHSWDCASGLRPRTLVARWTNLRHSIGVLR